MGVIENDDSAQKYVMLAVTILIYCFGCFRNVSKKYQKISKVLFTELKSRTKKDRGEESAESPGGQVCRGFQAKDADSPPGEQFNESEEPQNTANRKSDYNLHMAPNKAHPYWDIKNLVMFVDNNGVPSIPRELFEGICSIRAPGVPGPLHRGLLEAAMQLMKITVFVVFIFLVVMSLGSVYEMSAAYQTLVTLLLSFLPKLIASPIFAPPAPDVELDTASFRSKMNEVIKEFNSSWPVYDLPFKLVEENTPNTDDITAFETAQTQQNDGVEDTSETTMARLEDVNMPTANDITAYETAQTQRNDGVMSYRIIYTDNIYEPSSAQYQYDVFA